MKKSDNNSIPVNLYADLSQIPVFYDIDYLDKCLVSDEFGLQLDNDNIALLQIAGLPIDCKIQVAFDLFKNAKCKDRKTLHFAVQITFLNDNQGDKNDN